MSYWHGKPDPILQISVDFISALLFLYTLHRPRSLACDGSRGLIFLGLDTQPPQRPGLSPETLYNKVLRSPGIVTLDNWPLTPRIRLPAQDPGFPHPTSGPFRESPKGRDPSARCERLLLFGVFGKHFPSQQGQSPHCRVT